MASTQLENDLNEVDQDAYDNNISIELCNEDVDPYTGVKPEAIGRSKKEAGFKDEKVGIQKVPRIKGIKNLNCENCNYVGGNNSDVKRHNLEVHEGVKNFSESYGSSQ